MKVVRLLILLQYVYSISQTLSDAQQKRSFSCTNNFNSSVYGVFLLKSVLKPPPIHTYTAFVLLHKITISFKISLYSITLLLWRQSSHGIYTHTSKSISPSKSIVTAQHLEDFHVTRFDYYHQNFTCLLFFLQSESM